jgi:polyhydroxyalkanoate synthase
MLGGPMRFVLGASGHIAGVVNPPSKNRRNYWTNTRLPDRADEWFDHAESHHGSWWPDWGRWLAPHGGAMHTAPTAPGNATYPPLGPAPGRFVLESAG